MNNEFEFWRDALKDARKQLYMAKGAYMTIYDAYLSRKRQNVLEAIKGKTFHSEEKGHVRPIWADFSYKDNSVNEEPSATLHIHFVRDLTEVEQLQGLTARETALVKQFTEIYSKLRFTDRSIQDNTKYIDDLRKIQIDIEFLKNGILLYDRATWWYSSDSIFNEDFIEQGLSYSKITIMPSGEYRPKNNE